MKPIKVCYLLKRYPRLSQTFIVNEMLALRRLGVDLVIFASKGSDEAIVHERCHDLDAPIYYFPAADDLTLNQLSIKKYNALAGLPENLMVETLQGSYSQSTYTTFIQVAMMAPLLQSLGVTHIHGHFATWSARAASFLSMMTGSPFSFTAHARDIYHETIDKGALSERLEKARFVITVSDFNKRYLDQLLLSHGRSGTVIRLYNGMDLKQLQFDSNKKEPQLLVTVGRLVSKKGFHYLIKACKMLKDKNLPFKLMLIGEGEERSALEKQISDDHLQKEVVLLGARPQSEVIQLVQKAAIFVLPCIVSEDGDQDGLPTVILESMALGTPVISTDIAGIPEMITDGESGLLVPEKDAEALVNAIERLLRSKLLQQEYAEAARLRMEHDFNIDENAKQLKQHFDVGERTLE